MLDLLYFPHTMHLSCCERFPRPFLPRVQCQHSEWPQSQIHQTQGKKVASLSLRYTVLEQMLWNSCSKERMVWNWRKHSAPPACPVLSATPPSNLRTTECTRWRGEQLQWKLAQVQFSSLLSHKADH